MRKNSLRVPFLILIIILLCSSTAFAETATVKGSGINVRSGPGTSYGIFANLDDGMTVEVMNRSNPSWYLVSWEGNSGYVSSQYLVLEEDHSSAMITAARSETAGYINGMYVCLRSGPGTSYTILGTYSTGKTLTITGNSGDWISVNIDGKDGFVFHDFVSEGSPSAAVIEQEVQDVYGGTPIIVPAPSVSQGSTTVVVSVPVESSEQTTNPQQSGSSVPSVPLVPSSSSGNSNTTTQSPLVNVPSSETGSATVSPPVATPIVSSLKAAEITGNAVRFRTGPGTTYSIIGTYDAGTKLSVRETAGGWSSVIINGVSGYVYSDYIREVSADNSVSAFSQAPLSVSAVSADASSFRVTDGFITGSCVRLREAPSMSARILNELNFGNAVKMTGISGDWVKVIYAGQEGYVSSSFVTEGTFEPAPNLSQAVGTDLGKEIAAYALTLVGSPYKWGGNSPAVGFDCSGFVQYVFSQFGYSTSRVANDVRKDGAAVDASNMQPGDVLCFYSGDNYVGHVGIYIGDNSFVHAANSATGVVVTPLSSKYYASRGYEIRRIT